METDTSTPVVIVSDDTHIGRVSSSAGGSG